MELLKNVQEICQFQAVICFEKKANLKKHLMTTVVVIIIIIIIIIIIVIIIAIVITTVISRRNLKRQHKNIKKLTFFNKEFKY